MESDDPREGNKANHAGLSISYWRVELHIGSKKAGPLKTLKTDCLFRKLILHSTARKDRRNCNTRGIEVS